MPWLCLYMLTTTCCSTIICAINRGIICSKSYMYKDYCALVGYYWRFGETCFPTLQATLKMKAALLNPSSRDLFYTARKTKKINHNSGYERLNLSVTFTNNIPEMIKIRPSEVNDINSSHCLWHGDCISFSSPLATRCLNLLVCESFGMLM